MPHAVEVATDPFAPEPGPVPGSWLQFDQRRSSRHREPVPATGPRSCLYGIPVLNMTDSRNLGTQGAGTAKESPMKGKTDEHIMRGSQ